MDRRIPSGMRNRIIAEALDARAAWRPPETLGVMMPGHLDPWRTPTEAEVRALAGPHDVLVNDHTVEVRGPDWVLRITRSRRAAWIPGRHGWGGTPGWGWYSERTKTDPTALDPESRARECVELEEQLARLLWSAYMIGGAQ